MLERHAHLKPLMASALYLALSWTAAFAEPAVREYRSAADGLEFSYAPDATTPVIAYYHHDHLLAADQQRPRLQVFGDGRVLVHRPLYMKHAGDYTFTIDRHELDALIKRLSDNGMMQFDGRQLEDKRAAAVDAERRNGIFHHISDAVTTAIEIRLKNWRKATGSPRIADLRQKITLKNIEHDAKRFTDIDEIREAADSVAALQGIMARAKPGNRVHHAQ